MTAAASWDRIEAWLEANAEPVLKSLRKPAKAGAADKLAAKLGLALPADFVEPVARHDGQSGDSGLFPFNDGVLGAGPAWRLLTLKKAEGCRAALNELADAGEFADRPGWWDPDWLPVGEDGGGDHACLDLTPEGAGRVIHSGHDSAERAVLAPSFAAWLAQLAADLDTGRVTYDEDEGLVRATG